MSGKGKHNYDESTIKTLSSLEHIRARTGMYIGRTGDGSHYDDGLYIMVKEVVDNGGDEFIMGHGSRIEVVIEDNTVTVRDYGRGIPLGKVVDCVSRINTGAKYNDDVFQFSVGLNGVGTKAVNALSENFTVSSHREGRQVTAVFERGKLVKEHEGEAAGEPDGTLIRFSPDAKIFGSFDFRADHLSKRFRYYAYLNAGLEIDFNGKLYQSRQGLLDLIREECQFEKLYKPFHFRDRMLELAFTHTNRFNESYFSFVNGQYTSDGGTHLSAFREGLLKGINEFSKKRYQGDEVRDGIMGAVAIRLKEPIFESQTKNKLGNTEIRAALVNQIREVVIDQLHRHPKSTERLLRKIDETQKIRKELFSLKKMARQRSKSVSIRIPQLKDCKIHLNKKAQDGTDSTIFITEGQSAGGSLISCRDVHTQAIFTLKGKPLNVCDLNRDALYRNDEIYNLMRTLNIEDSLDGLRYQRVVLATDADVDGMHIRNLLITFFLRFFEPLVRDGHLHILETPLFRVRDKTETLYCFSEAERDEAVRQLARGTEITRFKGLGEISPKEFKAFIGEQMRLTPVVINGNGSIPEILNFYMGKNTQERRNYIMENLMPDITQ